MKFFTGEIIDEPKIPPKHVLTNCRDHSFFRESLLSKKKSSQEVHAVGVLTIKKQF